MAIFTTIVSTLTATLTASTFLSSLGGFLLKAAIGIGLSFASQALAGKPKAASQLQQQFGIQGKVASGGDLARSFLLGYAVTAGSLVWHTTWGEIDNTPNAFYTRVTAISDSVVSTIQPEVYVAGEKVTVLWGESIPAGHPVQEYRDDKGVDHLWIRFKDGSQTTADSWLVSLSTTDRPYQSTRVGRGVAYAIMTARVNESLFSGFPELRFAYPNSTKLYDPSKDSSVGGSGSQRLNNSATWGGDGDHLPAVQIYNILLGMTNTNRWLYGLQSLTTARLPAAHWIAQINKCRASITGPSGSEATYRAGGEIRCNNTIADTIEALLTTCQGRLVESGGIYKIFVGEPGSSVATISDDSILSTEEQSFSPFWGLAKTVTGITGKYPNPAEAWNTQEAPALLRSDYEATAGGRRLLSDVSFDYAPYKGQVQRLMKSALAEAQRARRHTIHVPPEYWPYEPGDVITWNSDRNGYVNKLFRIDGVQDKDDLDAIWDITEVDPTDYDWDQETDYRVTVDGPTKVVRPIPQPVVDWFAEGEVDYIAGKQRAAIRLTWNQNVKDDIDRIKWEVRRAADQVVVLRSGTDDVDAGSALISHNIFSNSDYEVRGRYIAYSGRLTTWSGWLAVTTPDAPFNDILSDLSTTGDDIRDYLKGIHDKFEDFFNNKLKTYMTNVMHLSSADVVDRQQFVRTFNKSTAKFTHEIALLTTDTEALAQEFTELSASLTTLTGRYNGTATVVTQLQADVTHLGDLFTSQATLNDQVTAYLNSLQAQVTSAGDAFQTLNTKVTQQGTTINTLSQNINAANARISSVDGKAIANATAIDVLETEVQSIGNDVSAVSTRTTAVEARTSRASAQGLFEIRATVKPTGTSLRLQMGARVVENGTTVWGGAYLDVTSSGTQWVFDSTKFIIINGANKSFPFVVENGVLKLGKVMVYAANIANAQINSAHIGNLVVDTIHIKKGAVTRRNTPKVYSSVIDLGVGLSKTVTFPSIAVSNPSGVATFLQLSWYCSAYFTGGTGSVSAVLRVKRGSVIVKNITMSKSGVGGQPASAGTDFRMVQDFPPTGNVTYTIELVVTSTGKQGRATVKTSGIELMASWSLV